MQTPNTVVLLLLSLASVIFTLVLVCIFCITMEEGGGIDARTKATCLMRKRGTFQKYTSSPLTWTTVKEWGEYRFQDHKLQHCPPPFVVMLRGGGFTSFCRGSFSVSKWYSGTNWLLVCYAKIFGNISNLLTLFYKGLKYNDSWLISLYQNKTKESCSL